MAEMMKIGCPGEDQKDNSYLEFIPSHLVCRILDYLDLRDVCSVSGTCRSLIESVKNHNDLWRRHHLAFRIVCPSHVQQDEQEGYTSMEIVQRNYKTYIVKKKWLEGKYSNIRSCSDLPDKPMCPMSADYWGDILEALERRNN